jgi:hypothetical protein
VPAAFTWIDDFEHWLGRKLKLHYHVKSAAAEPAPGAPPAQA